jgi:hypothetical protein
MAGNSSTLNFPVPGAAVRYAPSSLNAIRAAVPASEGGGAFATDAVFFRRNTFTGPGWQNQQNGMAAKFDGSTSYMQIGSSFTQIVSSDVFSVMFWFQRIGSSTSWAFFGAQDGGSAGLILDYGLHNAGKFSIVKNNVGQFTALWTADSLLHHIAYVASGTSAWIYLDGSLLATGAITAGLLTTNVSPVFWGCRDETTLPTAFFSGTMNDLRAYNGHAFSAAEVQEVYVDRWGIVQSQPTRRRSFSDAVTPVGSGTVSVGGMGWAWKR